MARKSPCGWTACSSLERQPRCTSNARGTMEGDPLDRVIVGDRASIQECLSAWDETESLTFATAWKTARPS
jgi:hypothetical protein